MPARIAPTTAAARCAGFTLLELLIGLAIMGLMLSAVPALLSKAVPGVEARGAAREMAAGLRAARGRAIASNRETALVLDVAGGAYRVEGEPKARRVPAGIGISLLTAEEQRLDDMLLKAADIYDAEVQRALERLLAVLVPALTLLLGALVAAVLGSVLGAILSVNELAQ